MTTKIDAALQRLPPLARCCLIAVLWTLPFGALADDGDIVLVRTPLVTLTKADYDAELQRLPPHLRQGFSTNAKRVTDLLNVILVNKTLAAQAIRDGLADDPEVRQSSAMDKTRVLAQRQLEAMEQKAGREFDALGDLTVAARERYVVDPGKFTAPEEVSLCTIVTSL